MLKRIEKISFRISSVLSNVEVEPKPGAGPSHRLRPKSAGSGSTTLAQSMFSDRIIKAALIWRWRFWQTRSWRQEEVRILGQFTRSRCSSWGSWSNIPSRKCPLSLGVCNMKGCYQPPPRCWPTLLGAHHHTDTKHANVRIHRVTSGLITQNKNTWIIFTYM